jgi:ribosomal protein S12 methylthiotransferase
MFVSLGCDKNLVDTEMMLGMLTERGHTFTDDETEAEVIVVNTCCFIGDAKEESINTLIELGRQKSEGSCRALIAAGCLAQRYHDEIKEQIPEVDVLIGTMAIDRIAEALDEIGRKVTPEGDDQKEETGHKEYLRDINAVPVAGKRQIVTTGGHFAYLKIAEGCDKHCTYCIIPKVRGNYRSIPMETLLEQAQQLVEGGVKELILVAQETTLYGADLYGEKCLPELLRKLCRISGLYSIRILYCYPEEITDELIQVMKEEPKICHYLDIPIQHASDAVLKRMGRRTDQNQLREMIGKLRKEIPDICLRTTLITGFPGESQEDFEVLYNFVDEMEFDRLGVFTYSQEEDTPAAGFADQIDEETKKDRQAELMELQQEIAFEKANRMKDAVVTAIVEGKVADENAFVARTYKDAPNVDGLIFVYADAELMTGDFVKVKVTGSYEYDLIGELQ